MAAPKRSVITVANQEQLENTIPQYLSMGFVVANRTEKMATLQKAKKFNVAIGIVGFLCCFIGLIIYAIWYSNQPDIEVVDIKIS